MSILCHIFGHRGIGTGWWGDDLYGYVTGGAKDGIGRTHWQVRKKCDRCGETYIMARFHADRDDKVGPEKCS